jgi:AcrR family transcriptional regulator
MSKVSIKPSIILDFALGLTKAEGIDTLTFRSLAKHMSISTFPIVQHFGTKAGLVQAVQLTLEQELEEMVAEVKSLRRYIDLLLGYTLFAWKEPKAFPAIKSYLTEKKGASAKENLIQAMKSSGDFDQFSDREFFTALGRLEIFNHGLSDLACRGGLHNPSQKGITEFFCDAVNDLVFGGKHEPFFP